MADVLGEYQPLESVDCLEQGSSDDPILLHGGERFQRGNKPRDTPFLALFAAHVVVVGGIAVKEAVQVAAYGGFSRHTLYHILILTILSILGAATGLAVLLLLRHVMRVFVIAVMIGSCCLPVLLAAVSLGAGQYGSMVVSLGSSGLAFLVFNLIRGRIEFATSVLQVAVGCLEENRLLYAVALVAVIPQAIWTLIVLISMYGTWTTQSGEPVVVNLFQYIAFVVSLFWTFQVIRNVVHVTTSGCVASWFYYPDQTRPPRPVHNALRRAVTVSLGSICLGSLLIALVQTVRYLLANARKQKKFPTLTKIAHNLAFLLEGVLAYFNKYTLVYIAVYGGTFWNAAKAVGKMISSRGFSMVLNDDITGIVLTFVCFINALVLSSLAIVIAAVFGYSLSNTQLITCLWVGYVTGSVITSVITSAVSTIYVCFMEESSSLHTSHIEAYNTLASAWMIMYGGQFKTANQQQQHEPAQQQQSGESGGGVYKAFDSDGEEEQV